MNSYQQAACQISRSKFVVALTGAGISVESGIPDFRSAGGLWSKYDPGEFGYIESFRANPAKVWMMLLELDALLTDALPNPAHYALVELERRGILKCVITQNVDSLHQRAGSINVVEFHGNNRTVRCDSCGKQLQREEISFVNLPPLCPCKGVMRPDLVFFGEMIPPEALNKATQAAQRCDLMVVIGTSASVAPASSIPKIAKQHGAYLLEINPQASELTHRLTDLHLAERAGVALPAIMMALDECNSL
jgi:NAD-dependent deacetylase